MGGKSNNSAAKESSKNLAVQNAASKNAASSARAAVSKKAEDLFAMFEEDAPQPPEELPGREEETAPPMQNS